VLWMECEESWRDEPVRCYLNSEVMWFINSEVKCLEIDDHVLDGRKELAITNCCYNLLVYLRYRVMLEFLLHCNIVKLDHNINCTVFTLDWKCCLSDFLLFQLGGACCNSVKFVSLLELHGSFVSIYPDDVHKIGVFHCSKVDCIDVLVLVRYKCWYCYSGS